MKINLIIALLVLILVSAGSTTVLAQDQYQKYEMADGHYVLFKMSLDQIRIRDAEKARRDPLKQEPADKLNKWVTAIELPESGEIINFPMSDEAIEIARSAQRQEAMRLMAIRMEKARQSENTQITVVEMADGNTVIFTRPKYRVPDMTLQE